MNTKKAEFEKDKGSKIMFYMYICINIYIIYVNNIHTINTHIVPSEKTVKYKKY